MARLWPPRWCTFYEATATDDYIPVMIPCVGMSAVAGATTGLTEVKAYYRGTDSYYIYKGTPSANDTTCIFLPGAIVPLSDITFPSLGADVHIIIWCAIHWDDRDPKL